MARLLILFAFLLANAFYGECRHHLKSLQIPMRKVSKDDISKIVGGMSTTIDQYPYTALVLPTRLADTYLCGGTIVSPSYVISAAHCTLGATKINVISASTSSTGNGGSTTVTYTYFNHPQYKPYTNNYDISIIKLPCPLTLGPNVGTASLPPVGYEIPSGAIATATGWGSTAENGALATTLQAAQIPVVNNTYCQQQYSQYSQVITQNMLCAGAPGGGVDTCQGDSGGPLVFTAQSKYIYLVGVVSFGIGCARPDIPGVYTKVASTGVRSWIKEKTGL